MAASQKAVFVAHPYRQFAVQDFREALGTVLAQLGAGPIYADQTIRSSHILDKIRDQILSSAFGIYDISNWNPNVTLELGLAMGLGHPWLLLVDTTKRKGVPADLAGFDRVEYESFTQLRTRLAEKLPAFMASHLSAAPSEDTPAESGQSRGDGRVESRSDAARQRLRGAGITTGDDVEQVLELGHQFCECLAWAQGIPPSMTDMGAYRDDLVRALGDASALLGRLDAFIDVYADRLGAADEAGRIVDIFRVGVRARPGQPVPPELFAALSEMRRALSLLEQDAHVVRLRPVVLKAERGRSRRDRAGGTPPAGDGTPPRV